MIEDLPIINFFDSDKITSLWQYIGAILIFIMPLFLIFAATELGGHLLRVIKSVFRTTYGNDEGEKHYDIKIKDKN